MDEVVISIKSEITDDDTSRFEFTTVGKMARHNDKWCVYYNESEQMLEYTKSVLKIYDDGVVKIIRSGKNNSRLVVEKGKRYTSQYETDVGSLNVAVNTNDVICNINNNGGTIHLDYSIDINAGFVSKNVVDITIRKEINNV